jgi:peptidyl-prolyl cis-trans isomerase C
MATANARHILVATEDQANDLKQQIIDGADFGDMAKQHSSCPSSANGGDLGQFGPGQMVPEFDLVIWNEAVGDVHGPVKTSFGYHLIDIVSRTD